MARIALDQALEKAGVKEKELDYLASTGEGDAVPYRTGHFYGMTTHARGALHLDPAARSVVDIGALHARVLVMDEHGKVLRYRMTSQCASGTGQFLENIARYLGVRMDEVGALSLAASRPEPVSGICAVLAETDVINMVSRGIQTGEILRGIHDSIAGRLIKLLRLVQAPGPVMLTGGLAADEGLKDAMIRRLVADKTPLAVANHELSDQAGAIGAAIWGAYRAEKMAAEGSPGGEDLARASA